MQIILNGKTRNLNGKTSVCKLLDELQLDTCKIAVEQNLKIIPKSKYKETSLNNGDKIEIVHFIAGG